MWPICGQCGYVTPAVMRIHTGSKRGAKSEMVHLWAKGLRHPCHLGVPNRFRAGGKIRSGPLVGKVATSPLPSPESSSLQSCGQNQKWPICGQSGYVTPAISGIPIASERRAKEEMAHLWANRLRQPCHLGDPGRFRLEVAHLWAKWLRHPCRLGDRHRCTAWGNFRSGTHMGNVATSPLPSLGSQPLQTRGQNQKWPSFGQRGYVTPAVSGIPTTSDRGPKSEEVHLWA